MMKLGHMVLKGVIWVHNDKIRSNGLERSQLGTQWEKKELIVYTMITLGQMVLKGVNWAHNDEIRSYVLKGVNWVHNIKIRSNGL